MTTRSGSSVSVGTAFGKSLCSTTAFCSTTAGDAAAAWVSGPDRQIALIDTRRGQFDADFNRRRAEVRCRRPAASNASASAMPPAWMRDGANRGRYPDRSRQALRLVEIEHLSRSYLLSAAARGRRLRTIIRHALQATSAILL